MTIEGIPDGWELVRFDHANKGESLLNGHGEIILYIYDTPSPRKGLIIRKIKKPKQFRAFANAAEAEPFFDRRLRYRSSTNAILRISVLGETGAEIAGKDYTYQQAFERFVCTDGTPFGVEVQS